MKSCQTNMNAVVTLLADTPALRSLSVGNNELGDAGLERLAALLPRLPGLRHLSVHWNGASHYGVSAILEAAGKLQAAGGTAALGLRELDISYNDIRAADAAQLARLLSRLHRLEALNLERTHLPKHSRLAHRCRGPADVAAAAPLARQRTCASQCVPGWQCVCWTRARVHRLSFRCVLPVERCALQCAVAIISLCLLFLQGWIRSCCTVTSA